MRSIEVELDRLFGEGRLRSLTLNENRVDFSTNDYLGLSSSATVRTAMVEALTNGCPLGATGSRLLGGNSPFHERTEAIIAESFAVESALLFSSGFAANLGVLSALGGEQTEFFSDELNHASLIDGMRLAHSARQIFRHNNVTDLARLLATSEAARKVIVTESVFSMDGDLAPLSDLISLARQHDAWLVVDEAHATGVFGSRGVGCLADHDTRDLRLIEVHTCGKALGAQGAFVLCTKTVRNFLVNHARSFIFSTGLAPLIAVQIEAAIRDVLANPQRGINLLAKAAAFRQQLSLICDVGKSQSQIVPVMLGSLELAMTLAEFLRSRGYEVRAIRAPTVPPGSERLRLSLKSFHTAAQLNGFIGTLREGLLKSRGRSHA